VTITLIQLTRMRSRLGAVMTVAVVLTGDESADVVDDKLIETAADFVKQNGVMANQIEVCTPCMVQTVRPPLRWLTSA